MWHWQQYWFAVNYSLAFLIFLVLSLAQPNGKDRWGSFVSLVCLGVSTYALYTLGVF